MATYRSSRRERQAQSTRADIVRAARRLFAERGYAATSMSDLAAEAEVAVPTIYASVGSKRELVLELPDLIDEEADVPALARQMASARTPEEVIAAGARLTRQIDERCGDIITALASAAEVDRGAADALQEGMRRHRLGTAGMARTLHERGALRPDLTADRAAAIIAVLTAHTTYTQLTREHGWSYDAAEQWVVRSLREQLLS